VSGRNALERRQVEQAIGTDVQISDFETVALELARMVKSRVALCSVLTVTRCLLLSLKCAAP
jgi:hypothetical protein